MIEEEFEPLDFGRFIGEATSFVDCMWICIEEMKQNQKVDLPEIKREICERDLAGIEEWIREALEEVGSRGQNAWTFHLQTESRNGQHPEAADVLMLAAASIPPIKREEDLIDVNLYQSISESAFCAEASLLYWSEYVEQWEEKGEVLLEIVWAYYTILVDRTLSRICGNLPEIPVSGRPLVLVGRPDAEIPVGKVEVGEDGVVFYRPLKAGIADF